MFANALDFLNTGLRVLFADEATPRDAKVGVVSIQTAVELLLKYRLVTDGGLRSIVKGSIPRGDLVAAASSGRLRTIGYSEGLKKIRQDESFSETERELFGRAQNLRNALVHFTADVDVDEVRMELAWVLIGALGIFGAGQDRDQGEMQTHATFLDQDVFERLTNFRPYRDQSVDSAIESRDGENVYPLLGMRGRCPQRTGLRYLFLPLLWIDRRYGHGGIRQLRPMRRSRRRMLRPAQRNAGSSSWKMPAL